MATAPSPRKLRINSASDHHFVPIGLKAVGESRAQHRPNSDLLEEGCATRRSVRTAFAVAPTRSFSAALIVDKFRKPIHVLCGGDASVGLA